MSRQKIKSLTLTESFLNPFESYLQNGLTIIHEDSRQQKRTYDTLNHFRTIIESPLKLHKSALLNEINNSFSIHNNSSNQVANYDESDSINKNLTEYENENIVNYQ